MVVFLVSLCQYAMNLGVVNLDSIDAYAVLEQANNMHIFATKHMANTCYEH